jgi:hypothetical protein
MSMQPAFGRLCALAAVLAVRTNAADAAPTSKAGTATKPRIRYLVTAGKLTQQLDIVAKSKREVAFKLDLSGTCQRTVSGTARLKGGDSESDEDETGEAYFADEYVHKAKDGCELFLRIQEKLGKRAIVMQSETCKATCQPVEDLMFRKDAADKTQPPK